MILFIAYLLSKYRVFDTPNVILFDHMKLKAICEKAVMENTEKTVPKPQHKTNELSHIDSPEGVLEARIAAIAKYLNECYPGHIHYDPRKSSWFHVVCGGAMGQLTVLHASISEYIIVYGTPIGTEGHSGRYFMDTFDYIIQGHHYTYEAGELRGQEHLPGAMTILPRGQSVGYRSMPHTYMVEYGRGFPGVIFAAMYPFVSAFFTTLDFYSLYKQLIILGRLILYELIVMKKF